MFSTAARAWLSPIVLAVLISVCAVASPASSGADDAALFRIFLLHGEPLVSYGEFARVADRVVFSVPLGLANETPTLQVVSIPASIVDWIRTEEYAHAVRAWRYAQTRGEEDFTLLASRVTSALNDINVTADPKRRLAMAEEARRNLAAWPAANYGYRAADVAQLVAMLDDVVVELRAATGAQPFELSFMATTVSPPSTVDVLPPPDLQTSMESAFRAALMAAEPAERIALLRALTDQLVAAPLSPATVSLRTRVAVALEAEMQVERAYGDLVRSSLRDAQARASRGDARGLQQIIARALSTDDRLGRRRSGEMSALLAALDLRLDEARRVRVAQEAWARRVEVFKSYRRATRTPRERMEHLENDLRKIRDLAGPVERALHGLEIRATISIHELRAVEVPPELRAAHGLLVTSLQLAQQAAALRRLAVSSNNTKLAWDASSAAAGALMLADRAADELRTLIDGR